MEWIDSLCYQAGTVTQVQKPVTLSMSRLRTEPNNYCVTLTKTVNYYQLVTKLLRKSEIINKKIKLIQKSHQ